MEGVLSEDLEPEPVERPSEKTLTPSTVTSRLQSVSARFWVSTSSTRISQRMMNKFPTGKLEKASSGIPMEKEAMPLGPANREL